MTISAIYDAFAFFIDTCVKVCSRCTNGAQSASICAMWTTISAVYDDFALSIDTCLKVCSRYTNGSQSASNCAIWITFSCVFNTSQIDVLGTFDGILEIYRQNLVTQK